MHAGSKVEATVATILIVDDSGIDRRLAGKPLESSGYQVQYAENGRQALDIIATMSLDAVVTDMVMPEVDGLELVKQIKLKFRSLPVIVMTAHGSEEIAVKALQIGAASYVPKKNISRDLETTLHSVLSVSSAKRAEQAILDSLTSVEMHFELKNETAAIRPLIAHMQAQLRQMQVCDDNDIVRVSTALQEALVNAIEHGNLEIDSALREHRDGSYGKLVKQRAAEEPYCQRRVRIQTRMSRDAAEWVICDEGPGYNPDLLPDPRDPANLQKVSGRGLLLIRTFMDEVSFNATANEIRMVKRRAK